MGISLDNLPVFRALGQADKFKISQMSCALKRVGRHSNFIAIGDKPEFAYFMLSGWAARYRFRRNGSRRITGFMLPGDLCSLHALANASFDSAMLALTDCCIGLVSGYELVTAMSASPGIRQAIHTSIFVNEATSRTWLTNSQDSVQSLAHLLCELHMRYNRAEAIESNRFPVPMSQEVLGDALGITSVHANRVLRQLRLAGLVECKSGFARIQDIEALREFCGFNAEYLI